MDGLPCGAITKDTKNHKGTQRELADWLIGECGALPHAPAGEGRFRARRTENRERRTERPYGRQIKRCTRETKLPNLQTSKLPLAPAPPARLRRANKHDGMTSTPQQEMQERPASGRRMKTLEDRQGAKRRAAGTVSGGAAERPTEPEAVRAPSCVFAVKPLRSLGGYAAPPTYPQFQQSYKQRLIKLSAIGTVINAFYRIINKVINSG